MDKDHEKDNDTDRMSASEDLGGVSREPKIDTTTTFWWEEGAETVKIAPNHSKKTSMSVLNVLEDTFGLAIHEHSKTAKSENGSSSSLAEKRLEIKRFIASGGKDSQESELSNALKELGRLVDASRLSIHVGLHDMVHSLDQKEVIDGRLTLYQSLLVDQIENSRFFDQFSPSISCFEDAFATQIGLAILSWSLGTYEKTIKEEQGEKHIETNRLALVCQSCLDAIRQNVLVGATVQSETWESQDLEAILRTTYFNQGRDQTSESSPIDTATRKLEELRNLISWVRNVWIPHHEEIDISEEPLEERIVSVWSIAKDFLSAQRADNNRQDKNGKDSPPQIDSLENEFRCLKVIILMGYTISGCLSNFAYTAVGTKATRNNNNNNNNNNNRGDGLSTSSMAAWSLLDTAINHLLKDTRKLLGGIAFLELILAPLFAYSIASASYLRNYSTAQNRLVECLSGKHHRMGSTNFMMYSELLWSQLVQLRMSLPNEVPAMAAASILGGAGGNSMLTSKKLVAKRDVGDDFPWEPSQKLKEENKKLIAKLESLDIRLRHVVLWGDWVLSSLAGNTESSSMRQNTSGPAALLRMVSQTPFESKATTQRRTIEIRWKDELEVFFANKLDKKRTTLTDFAEDCLGTRSSHPLSTAMPPRLRLPLFLLHAGKYLTDLDLNGCSLQKLPLSFGLYFPNLRRLVLAHNDLRELPESFRRLTRRMRFLEIFNAAHNKLKHLPSDMFSVASTTVPNNNNNNNNNRPSLAFVPPAPVLWQVTLHDNHLVSLPSLVGLDRLSVLELQNNALVDMSPVDWSKLALRLPSLRILNSGGQNRPKAYAMPRKGSNHGA